MIDADKFFKLVLIPCVISIGMDLTLKMFPFYDKMNNNQSWAIGWMEAMLSFYLVYFIFLREKK